MKRLVTLALVLAAACAKPAPHAVETERTPDTTPRITEFPDAGTEANEPPEEPLKPVYETGDPRTAILLRRTACHGRCPMYSLGISASGNVHFLGEMFTHKIGYATAVIPAAEVSALLAFIAAHRFDKLPAEIKAVATDHPSAVIVVRRAGKTKVVRHDTSATNADATAIADEIDRVAGAVHWIGSSDEAAKPASGARDLPSGVLDAMLGDQRKRLVKCASKDPMKIDLTIDDVGKASARTISGKAADQECMKKALATVLFPIGGVESATLTVASE